MKKKIVLFVCIHNSARSQMAEAFLNQICGEEFEAHSAGIEPGKLNPIVVEAMQEIGIDISGNKTKAVSIWSNPARFCLCHHCLRRGERGTLSDFCGRDKEVALEFSRPLGYPGHARGKARGHPEIRDMIKAKVEAWCEEVCPAAAA